MTDINIQTLPKEILGQDMEVTCAVDLSASQYCFVKKDSSNLLVLCGNAESSIGILQNAPVGTASAPVQATVRYLGQSKLYTAGDITEAAYIGSDAAGKGLAVASDHNRYNAVAQSNSLNGDITVVKLTEGTISV